MLPQSPDKANGVIGRSRLNQSIYSNLFRGFLRF